MPEEWRYPGVYVEETAPARAIEGVPTSVTAFVGTAVDGATGVPVRITSFAEFEQAFGGLWQQSLLGYAVRDFFDNDGRTAVVLRLEPSAPGMGLGPGDLRIDEAGVGLRALDEESFNLLVVPPYPPHGSVDTEVVAAAATYCEQRRAMLLVDAPQTWEVDDVVAAAEEGLAATLGTTSANAALFFPWLLQADPLRAGAIRTLPAAGAVAGVIARTDAQRGVWKAPAGVEARLSAVDLGTHLDDRQAGLLNPRGVNTLRSFAGLGPVVWGARTLQGDDLLSSEWKYLPVRRTALFIEESLRRGLPWTGFEPNGEELWARVRLEVGNFLYGLFRQGAFAGRTPNESFVVRCDAGTTTRQDLDEGFAQVVVGFAPLRPAEFVIVRVRLRTRGTE